MTIRIGTRKSPLALAQAHEVAFRLNTPHEIIAMTTTGDQLQDRTLAEEGGKGLFTKELEEALLLREVDIAVHSMKDMPTVLPDGLIVPCTLQREDVRDVLISHKAKRIIDLPQGAKFGTASLRRAAQVLAIRPDLQIVPLRGNVQTRIRKIEDGVADATMLARAGLNRLKLTDVAAYDIEIEECLPAVAQGAIGVECREFDDAIIELLEGINCKDTFAAITCERAFLKVLDGSCRTPIAGYARIEKGEIHFTGLIASPDGKNIRKTSMSADVDDAERLGIEAAERLRVL
jgi:hydroxymethylbilane synthase